MLKGGQYAPNLNGSPQKNFNKGGQHAPNSFRASPVTIKI